MIISCWDAIRMKWVEGLKSGSSNFLNRTNNPLESLNVKLKSVVTRYSDMVSFFQDLMKCIASLKTEQNQRALNTISKNPLTSYRTESHKEYGKLLTSFAYLCMKKELNKAEQAEVLMLRWWQCAYKNCLKLNLQQIIVNVHFSLQ